MSPDADDSLDGHALSMLELLAQEAPAERFEEPVRRAAADGVPADALARLNEAKDHALSVRQLFGRRQQREAGLSALVDTARDLTLPYNLDALLKVITRRARLLLGLDMSWVSLHDSAGELSRVRAADGNASAITVGFEVPSDGGVGRQARQGSAPFWTPDYLRDESFEHAAVIDDVVRVEGLRAIVAVPLRHADSSFGVLYAADRNVRHFVPDEISLMSSLADLAAVAIERTSLLEQARSEATELAEDTSRAWGRSAAATRLHGIHSDLIDLILQGGDLHTLLGRAAGELDAELMVRDAVGKDLERTAGFPEPGAGRARGDASAAPEPSAGRGRLPVDEATLVRACLDSYARREPIRCESTADDGTEVWVHAVTGGSEHLGTLVVHRKGPVEDDRRRLMALTAQTVAVLMLMQRSTVVAEAHVRDDFFHELLASQLSPEQLATRARRLGVNLAQPHVVVVARPEGGAQGRAVVWASSYVHQRSGLKYVDGEHIVLLVPGDDATAAGRTVSRELSVVLAHPVTAGAAGPVTALGAVRSTYEEAQRCLDALTALGSTGGAASPRELGFLGLLLSDRHDVGGFIASTLGPVLDYDSQQATELLRTLEEYFTSGNSPTRAAETLHVHPNTVSRRLERITYLLGSDWQEPARALEVQLALRLQRARQVLEPDGGPPSRPGP
ncbi:helix-turn-helix domain-containing protein [Streptomyces sp. PTY087I2]|uniref:helix-turn-helix domain-containing protein n=1 Tax=Streptomyces sp. PTY087I2 TaxID=1819298 RepID=UPI00080BD26E|nr:helix-turn-helix domain-containing protein [Streptomyces sp. PTY087I2]OCC08636.1 Purine catabolism regulatory protein [Streptomyces sp. PTY087I2]